MKAFQNIAASAVLWIALLASLTGCRSWGQNKVPTPPLGTQSDCNWRQQAAGALASDFVIYQNEFEYHPDHPMDRVLLNMDGEDHLKSIAARLHCGAALPVIVERSTTSIRPDSEYQYPVNPNPELDIKRRDLVVRYLVTLGITNAEQCVEVAPAMAEGYTATEAIRAYDRGLTESTNNQGGFGGGIGNAGGGAAF